MANLSGSWLGTYWQDENPTRFELTLVQGGNTLSGRILDNNDLGEASLVGDIVGRNVSFTKTYLTNSKHTVSYTGTVSEDENYMSGSWEIDFLSGRWEANRQDDNLTLNLEIIQQKKQPVSLST